MATIRYKDGSTFCIPETAEEIRAAYEAYDRSPGVSYRQLRDSQGRVPVQAPADPARRSSGPTPEDQ